MSGLRRTAREHLRALGIEGVVIYGLRRNNHSHHYIHKAFFKAFQDIAQEEIGLEVLWCDDVPGQWNERRNLLFLIYAVPGHSDQHVPLKGENYYLVHGTSSEHALKYLTCFEQTLFFDEYRGDPNSSVRLAQNYIASALIPEGRATSAPFVRYSDEPSSFFEHVSASTRTVVTTWGTDLLPQEIESGIPNLPSLAKGRRHNKSMVFVGSVWHRNVSEMGVLVDACREAGLRAEIFGGFIDEEFIARYGSEAVIERRALSDEESRDLIARARFAPTVQGAAQVGYYVPCRLFKNLSYGSAAFSNNPILADALDTGCVVDSDVSRLIQIGAQSPLNFDVEYLSSGMREVALKHTYLSRINFLLEHLVAMKP